MSTADSLRAWLEETGHGGCAEDLAVTVRDHPADAPAMAYHIAEHVEADTPAYAHAEAQYLPAELRAWADAQEGPDPRLVTDLAGCLGRTLGLGGGEAVRRAASVLRLLAMLGDSPDKPAVIAAVQAVAGGTRLASWATLPPLARTAVLTLRGQVPPAW